MTCSPAHLASQIREKGFRLTPQRMAILTALHDGGGHLSPAELYARVLTVMPAFTEPTLYRTLDFLCQHDLVRATHVGSGHLEYEIAAHEHHHLVCRGCGQMREVSQAEMQAIYDEVEARTGFRLLEYHITFNGLCPLCKS